MKSRWVLVWAVCTSLASMAAIAAGCSSGSGSGGSCSAGETRACSCAGGGSATQTCGDNGSYGACACGGAEGGADGGGNECDGGHGSGCGDGGGLEDVIFTPNCSDAGPLGFDCPCTQASDCQSGDCFDFAAKGMKCTMPCTMASDCPNPPNLGCNGMGQCKAP